MRRPKGLEITLLTAAVLGVLPGGAAAQGSVESDRAALVALYEATGGPNWRIRHDWLTDAPLGQWKGVTTTGAGRVVGLNLEANNLTGRLPAAIGELDALERLQLRDNDLTGLIPNAIGNLTNLQELRLRTNALTGQIPAAIGNLTNLEYLTLSENDLAGPIPEEIGNLTNLEELYMRDNRLNGPIPDAIGNLTNLRALSLRRNDLTGLPAAIGRLTNLRLLAVSGNNLTGSIPEEIGNLTHLHELALFSNNLSGPVPDTVGQLTTLVTLNLSSNSRLAGPLPLGLRSAESLGLLDIEYTQLCAPATWRDWLATLVFRGNLCSAVPALPVAAQLLLAALLAGVGWRRCLRPRR